MQDKDKLKSKINALLSKTLDRGASQAEMEAALSKANDLMTKHFITKHDLEEHKKEKCVLLSVPLVKSGYNLSGFYNALSKLFDCEYYYNAKAITFFGFKQDTQLCAYFYEVIVNTCLAEKAKYMKSASYKCSSLDHHGRTLVVSFIRGFMKGISAKMQAMYKDRVSSVKQKYGIVPTDKMDAVKFQFENLDLKISTASIKKAFLEQEALTQGLNSADKVNLKQGIEHKQETDILKLSSN